MSGFVQANAESNVKIKMILCGDEGMPIYVFRCAKCGHRFEKLIPFSKAGEVTCEKCGEKTERVYDGAGVFCGKSSSGCSGNCGACPGCGSRG